MTFRFLIQYTLWRLTSIVSCWYTAVEAYFDIPCPVLLHNTIVQWHGHKRFLHVLHASILMTVNVDVSDMTQRLSQVEAAYRACQEEAVALQSEKAILLDKATEKDFQVLFFIFRLRIAYLWDEIR